MISFLEKLRSMTVKRSRKENGVKGFFGGVESFRHKGCRSDYASRDSRGREQRDG
jgi:hypothetical protein